MKAWVHDVDTDLGTMVLTALDELRPADLEVLLLASTGDTVTVQVVDGRPPVEPGERVYVEQRGAYELVRREPWPGGRVLLALRAWPAR